MKKIIRDETITFSVTERTKQILVNMADSEERTLSALIRMVLKKHIKIKSNNCGKIKDRPA